MLGIKDIQNNKKRSKCFKTWEIVYEVFRDEIKSLSKKLSEHSSNLGLGFSDTIIISLPVTIHAKGYRDLTKRDDYWWMNNKNNNLSPAYLLPNWTAVILCFFRE
jgi:hypothetical protein